MAAFVVKAECPYYCITLIRCKGLPQLVVWQVKLLWNRCTVCCAIRFLQSPVKVVVSYLLPTQKCGNWKTFVLHSSGPENYGTASKFIWDKTDIIFEHLKRLI